MSPDLPPGSQLVGLKRLRLAAAFEGGTLLLLVGVAVPLKHLAHEPWAVSVIGPIHGVAFLAYLWMAIETASAGLWRRPELVRLLALSALPFGFWWSGRLLRNKAVELQNTSGRPGNAKQLS